MYPVSTVYPLPKRILLCSDREAYDITRRERYERALDDPSLLPGDDPGNPFLVAQLRAVSAHLQGLDVRMQGIEGRMASIEEFCKPEVVPKARQPPVKNQRHPPQTVLHPATTRIST
ncbi:hypothetical protein GQ600_19222 [Phytophthora cactorum]|nr:hypothetical protein GQ600_19222 [Phytophthora cactorum]